MDEEFDPTTFVVKDDTKRAKGDRNEILLDNSEISDDDSAGDIDDDETLEDIARSHDDTPYLEVVGDE